LEKTNRYDKLFIETAILSSEMSFCKRRKVGAILTKDTRIISNGWNGTVSGEDNCCEEDYGDLSEIEIAYIDFKEDQEKEAQLFCKESDLTLESFSKKKNKIEVKYRRPQFRTKQSVVHAEANAIAYAAKAGLKTEDCTLYVTLSPCMNCSNLIIQAGIKEVIFKESYRDSSGVEHLERNGIKVRKY